MSLLIIFVRELALPGHGQLPPQSRSGGALASMAKFGIRVAGLVNADGPGIGIANPGGGLREIALDARPWPA